MINKKQQLINNKALPWSPRYSSAGPINSLQPPNTLHTLCQISQIGQITQAEIVKKNRYCRTISII